MKLLFLTPLLFFNFGTIAQSNDTTTIMKLERQEKQLADLNRDFNDLRYNLNRFQKTNRTNTPILMTLLFVLATDVVYHASLTHQIDKLNEENIQLYSDNTDLLEQMLEPGQSNSQIALLETLFHVNLNSITRNNEVIETKSDRRKTARTIGYITGGLLTISLTITLDSFKFLGTEKNLDGYGDERRKWGN
jgi:hypothetical protein